MKPPAMQIVTVRTTHPAITILHHKSELFIRSQGWGKHSTWTAEKTSVLTGTQGTATPARRTLQKGRQEQ
jgi:hypothetical protein